MVDNNAQQPYSSLYFEYRSYPFRRPQELGSGLSDHKVAIVGAGPVGMALALDLAQRGIPTVIIEKGHTESPGSRAACISRRSIEILHRLGAGAAFDEIALPWTSGTSFYRGAPIFRLEMPHGDMERHFPMANIQQNILERILIELIAKEPAIDLRWQSDVIGIHQNDEGVTLQVRTPDGDYELTSSYVVAADGARSAIRSGLNLKLSGATHSAHYLIADIKLQSNSPTERRAWFDSPVNRGSTILMHRQPYDIWRVDYQLREDDDPEEEAKPDRIKQRIQSVLDMAGETGDWEIDWISRYRAYSLCLDSYKHHRVFFAGDAAHLVPIFGVKGLNSGLADADNLGWKLAAVLHGFGGPALLESYNQERRAATQDIFLAADKSTRFMTPPTRGYQLMRKATLSLALSQPWAGRLADPRQSAPFCYSDSALNSLDSDNADFSDGPAVGASAPSVRLDDRYLHEYLDTRPTIIWFENANAISALPALRQTIEEHNIHIIIVSLDGTSDVDQAGFTFINDKNSIFAQAWDATAGTWYLLRPDWHVCARTKADTEMKKLGEAIERMYGHA